MSEITDKVNTFIKNISKTFKEVNENCSEEEVEQTLKKLDLENYGYVKLTDYCTVETAMTMLDLGLNRNRFYELIDLYGVKLYKNPVNNQALGYKIKEIEKVLAELNKNT